MKITIKMENPYEECIIEVPGVLYVHTIEYEREYHVWNDEKWKKFCKEHHFDYKNDVFGKIYDLYLRLCAEGMI